MSSLLLCLVILLSPFIGMVLLAAVGRVLPRQGDWLALGTIGLSLAAAVMLFLGVFGPETLVENYRFDWIRLNQGGSLGNGILPAGVLVDPLTRTMLLVVAVVSFLVHLFSTGYMHGDSRYLRYFANLQLFSFSMFGLVMANNLLTLYIFWELVGLSSYLLIGHYFDKMSAARACMKAFITTRVGDVGMFFGILIIWYRVGSLDYEAVFAAANGGIGPEGAMAGTAGLLTGGWKTLAGLGIFFGAMGKSAQFPLHVWLPDAMEGPTPVSAMIHAATMVAAGVYLVGRVFPIFDATTLIIIAVVGGFTAFFAATIALVQDDIKKVLAYSTVSQLGYMMLGLGAGSFVAGLFHMTTHAAFKALLFLAAGSVIHAMHHEQSMDHYGGLRKKLPITFATFFIATMAISGFPFITSGFYSKDLVIMKVFEAGLSNFHGAGTLYLVLACFALLTACMTTFYMFRAVFLTFFGKPRDHHAYDHAHESPFSMTVPLMVLAVFSLIAGGFALSGETWFPARMNMDSSSLYAPYADHQVGYAANHAVAAAETHGAEGAGHEAPVDVHAAAAEHDAHGAHAAHLAHSITLYGTISALIIGLTLAWVMYIKQAIDPARIVSATRPVYDLLRAKYYIDEFYDVVFLKSIHVFARIFAWIDTNIVDGFVNLWGLVTCLFSAASGFVDRVFVDGMVNQVGQRTQMMGSVLAVLQTGRVRHYLMFSVAAVGVVAVAMIVYLK